MCLIALAWRVSARFPLVVAANRDEAFERPSLPAQQWPDAPQVYGGRDLLEGGSWMALSRSGRLAAVTNVREPLRGAEGRSRGHLVRDFLLGDGDAGAAASWAAGQGDAYRPFNLLLWDGRELVHATNRPRPGGSPLRAGVHGISNGPLDAQWPKVRWTVASLRSWIAQLPDDDDDAGPDVAPLFAALADEQRARVEDLPDTGVPPALEHRLSAPFIRGADYGTRASTVLLVDRAGKATLSERSFGPGATPLGERRIMVQLQRW